VKFISCILFSLLAAPAAWAQGASAPYDPAKTYTITQLQEDVDALYQTMKEINPSLYNYRSKRQVDSMFRVMAGGIQKPMTAIEARKQLIVPAVVFLQDLHYVVYPSPAEEEYLRNNSVYFPFDVKISNGRMYIWHNLSADSTIQDKGRTEIHSINGERAADVMNRLEQYIVTDGNSKEAKRRQDLEESFRSYYALVYGREEQFRLSIVTQDNGKLRNINVAAQGWEAINKNKDSRYTENPELPGLETRDDAHLAILSMKTFTPELKGAGAKGLDNFIDSAFSLISQKGIDKLVLDLRGNIGGRLNYGGKLYSYLTNKPFTYLNRVEVAYPHTFKYINNTSLGRTYLTNTYGIRQGEDSVYTLENFQFAHEQKAAAKPYTGKLYVLTDGYTLSTTALLCAMLRAYRPDTYFIGEETGGAYGNCSGMLTLLNLPNTGIRVYFPIRKYVSSAINEPGKNKGYTDRGILPDFEVHPTIEGLMRGTDEIMIKAMNEAMKP